MKTYSWITLERNEYKYWVFEIPVFIADECFGNYIFCIKDQERFIPVYIGEGLLSLHSDLKYHPEAELILAKKPTHLHIHLNGNEWLRVNELQDLKNTYGELK